MIPLVYLIIDNHKVPDQGYKVGLHVAVPLIAASFLVQKSASRFHLHLLLLCLQESHLHNSRTVPKVCCTLFSMFLCEQPSTSSEPIWQRTFSTVNVSIFCMHSLLLLRLPVTILSLLYFVNKNQDDNALHFVRSLCSVRSAAANKISNTGISTITK